MAGRKPPTDKDVTKTYRVKTPLRIDENTQFDEGEKIEMLESEATELVEVGALVEL